MNDVGTAALRAEYHDGKALAKADRDFFDDVLDRVTGQAASLDAAFSGFLDRDLNALDQVGTRHHAPRCLRVAQSGGCPLQGGHR